MKIVFTEPPNGVSREGDGDRTYRHNIDVCEVDPKRGNTLIGMGLARRATMEDELQKVMSTTGEVDPHSSKLPQFGSTQRGLIRSADPVLWFVIPTYNRRDAVTKQVDLILDQTEVPEDRIRVCVVNDGGNDPNLSKDSRLVYVRTGMSNGPNMARHLGIQLAPVDSVIVEIDDHDFVEPGAIGAIRSEFLARTCMVVYGDHYRVNSSGEALMFNGFAEKGEYTYGDFMTYGALHTGMRAYQRSLYDLIGGYREEETPAGDLGLFLRFEAAVGSRLGAIKHLARPLCKTMVHIDGISISRRDEQEMISRRLKYLAREGLLFSTEAKATSVGDVFTKSAEPPAESFADVEQTVVKDEIPEDAGLVALIPAYRCSSVLGKSLACLHREGVPVVVCENGADPEVSKIIEAAPGSIGHVRLSRNCGYGHAVNTAARIALRHNARKLMVCCSDAFVGLGTPAHAVHEMDRLQAGVVGTTHQFEDGRHNSHGSEWHWPVRQPQQVPTPLLDPLGDQEAPVERDFVTFANVVVQADVWREVNGLDERYRVGYWEDVDFCARVKQAGHKIFWVGGPPTTHLVGKGGGGGRNPRAWEENAKLFRGRFEDTGLVDKWARARGRKMHDGQVVGCIIACNEEEFIAPSIESFMPLADRVIVVYGGTESAYDVGMCTEAGLPIDSTVEQVRSIPDPKGIIEEVFPPGRPWTSKDEQREAYAELLNEGDYMILLDADEIFTDEGLWRFSRHMHFADIVRPGHWTIWNDFQTIGTGVWDSFQPLKSVKWHKGYTYKYGHTRLSNQDGKQLVFDPSLKILWVPDERIFVHYSWVRPLEKIRQKSAYYIANSVDGARPDYFETIFMGWRKDPKKVEEAYGTHPRGRGGTAPLPIEHPPSIQKLLDAGKLGGSGW